VNAKSGLCSEDCSFCSQSRRSKADIRKYPLIEEEEMVRAAREAKARGAREFSIVSSGLAMRNRGELERVGNAIERIRSEVGIETCVSLGTLSAEDVSYLLSRGLRSLHHNLETSRSFFPSVCTTHDYEEDVRAVREAKAAGAWVCCGGIFGIGETALERVELAMTLRELSVDSIPVNFLNPVPGTPVEGRRELTPFDCLKIIAMMRLVHPRREIIVCGGREVNLRDLQSLMFAAGATGTMAGNYLTTAGRPAEDDIRMIRDLGLAVLPA
jgi:biotin synthase